MQPKSTHKERNQCLRAGVAKPEVEVPWWTEKAKFVSPEALTDKEEGSRTES